MIDLTTLIVDRPPPVRAPPAELYRQGRRLSDTGLWLRELGELHRCADYLLAAADLLQQAIEAEWVASRAVDQARQAP